VLFLLQIPEQDIEEEGVALHLPAHRIYRADLCMQGMPSALASLHRDGIVEELEALLELLVGG
jgi:hypothetical protein